MVRTRSAAAVAEPEAESPVIEDPEEEPPAEENPRATPTPIPTPSVGQPLASDHSRAVSPPIQPPPASPSPAARRRHVDPEAVEFLELLGQTIGDAFTNAFVQLRQTNQPNPAKYPKAKDPTMFNGQCRKYLRTWIGENEICFRTAPNLYRSDISKVMFAGSFLEGDAKTWFTDYFRDPANIPTFMSNWELFSIELQRNFGLEDEVGAAEEDLRKLSMSDRDHATYFTARFRAVSSTLNGLWDDRNLRNMYYQRIAPRLRAQFISAGVPVPATLEPLITVVERFDRAYWADFELNRSISHPI